MAYDIAELPPGDPFQGAGVYTIHYAGSFAPYAGLGETPIYVGRADNDLHGRLSEHAAAIEAAENLRRDEFGCRWLVLEPIWINLTEKILIDRYRPIWNKVLIGFGIHDPGGGRRNQRRSQWDTVHPGRSWSAKQREPEEPAGQLLERITQHRRQEQ